MGIKRIGRHLLLNRWRVRRAFPRQALTNIEKAIKTSEALHTGQIRFAVEGALDGVPLFKDQSARARSIDVFANLRVWDTENSNGVLIYLLLADRDVEIVADRGINEKVQQAEWEAICRLMETEFRAGNFEGGVLTGVAAVTKLLAKHFPASGAPRNELPDKPVVM
ncbi:putative membrane protein [Afipia massiliensis]|uniref:Putative membrane protein n=1 Tax=Afipia massiliensis TaxID=211460 RepID=A0A840N0H0_9BRAD|nr:TPM domain-containing protein [Afipia massiliensis]MBB5052462.1 putative membrane protein [Afipia massiliensis]